MSILRTGIAAALIAVFASTSAYAGAGKSVAAGAVVGGVGTAAIASKVVGGMHSIWGTNIVGTGGSLSAASKVGLVAKGVAAGAVVGGVAYFTYRLVKGSGFFQLLAKIGDAGKRS